MEDGFTALRLAAPAKLNLSLRVVGARQDGFHEIETIMVLLDLADDLVLAAGEGGLHIEAGGSAAGTPPDPASNLAWRGLMAGIGGPAGAWSLSLTKRVAVAAGLGGGSSDAAAAWRLGRSARNAPEGPTQADLAELAAIGADVPFFAARVAAARVTGIGERVEATEMPAGGREVVLVLAPFQLSTAEVFAELRPDDWGSAGPSGNDLLAPARRLRPELDEIARAMRAAGVEPSLSGSGPTFFTILDDPKRADAAAQRLQGQGIATWRTRLRTEPASIEAVSGSTQEQR
jgi:4-diphosphocytidyl-2-C-methyl-D-erythritol kinase